jgi:hypothetical protein
MVPIIQFDELQDYLDILPLGDLLLSSFLAYLRL